MAAYWLLNSRAMLGATAIGLALAAGPVMADTIFTPTSDGFVGDVSTENAAGREAVVPGSKVIISGEELVPGQELTLMRGTTVLNGDGPLVVDAEGKFSFEVQIDEAATTGLQPILVIGEKPAAATVVDLKVSPSVPLSGEDRFTVTSQKVTRGLYQVAYSHKNDALFVASAVGRPPVKESALSRISPETLAVDAQINPAEAPARPDGSEGGLFALYGVAVDDTNDNVWVTNTRQNTVAVYKQSDLSLVKQFEPGAVDHGRDVAYDPVRNRVYSTPVSASQIEVFDAATLEKLDPITVRSGQRGEDFSPMSLALDAEAGTLATVSISTNEAAIVDLASGEARVFDLPGAKSASGAAYDAQGDLLFVASQGTDNLLIINAKDGTVLHDVETGAGALNVAFEPKSRLAYVANRDGGTITVVNTDGEIVANLDGGSLPNHVYADGLGNIWAVNKSKGEDDARGDHIWKITPVAE